ncbi:hypothetical protein O987_21010 [Comamonas testosteroni TK102]|uniref:Uncharacterized protein n=1 Tax=Comamonas testosteroni TK102 TaxID=1392005 RepID=A0A076PN65_COMTE|nr:hypothetical protein O987_21010 [Comamonas testosteroni TK102]
MHQWLAEAVKEAEQVLVLVLVPFGIFDAASA